MRFVNRFQRYAAGIVISATALAVNIASSVAQDLDVVVPAPFQSSVEPLAPAPRACPVSPFATGLCSPASRATACPEYEESGGMFDRWHEKCALWKAEQQYKWWGYPEEFEELPLGMHLEAARNVQIAKGQAARMVLYDYDFVEGSDKLNSRGQRQLYKIGTLMACNGSPIIVEWGQDTPKLDQARRLMVMGMLSSNGFAVSPERVQVGSPLAVGLRGVEATIIQQRQLSNTSSGGVNAAVGSGGFTSSNSSSGRQGSSQ